MSNTIRHIRSTPSAVLLFSQLLAVVLYPFLRDTPGGRAAIGVVTVLILFAAIRLVRSTPALTWVAFVLGLPSLVFVVVEAIDPTAVWAVSVGSTLHAAFYFYLSFAMIRYLFHDDFVSLDELFALAAAFTVVMWAFAYVFVFVETVWPGSYAPIPATNQFFEALFVSFTTLTGVGISDIVPSSDQGRAALMLAELTGVMYLALVVSRLVGLTIMGARNKQCECECCDCNY